MACSQPAATTQPWPAASAQQLQHGLPARPTTAAGKPENTATAADGAQIVDSGQLRKGTIVPDLNAGL